MTRDAATPQVRAAVRQGLSVAVATGLYGISFGALSVAAGVGVWPTMALSLLMFSGGSQFALVGVIGAGGSPGAAVATAALLGVRNGLYGAVVTPVVRARGLRRLLAAQVTIDESTAVSAAQNDRRAARVGFWVAGVGVFVLWNLFTLLGALAGDALGDPRAWGLDAAAAAAFLGLVWPRLAPRRAQLVAAVAAAVSVALVPFVPPGVPVIGAAAAAIVVGLVVGDAAPGPDDGRTQPDDDASPEPEGATR
ncbi:AzlC family ABC transporter permease [Xylanimonas protaetiae]|uniref:Branched-chain amino acid ABC transporter permease n=1 Tax=Xylanimonas protaetiae TaxID=2509457 RepID=A0A4P6F4R4_9MICO|nr:AzlC family ABC transporter permease [Xylanimonas protaetiae]QAY70584.1 branched-chain amino acid ABC transporter permease [Xylanimonas protaetiae]